MEKGKTVKNVVFFSPHGKYKINDEEKGIVIAFKSIREGSGSPGVFDSSDENIINYMRDKKEYGKKYSDKPGFKATIQGFSRDEIIAGLRSAANNVQMSDAAKAQIEETARALGVTEGETSAKQKLAPLVKEYGELQAKCTNSEGKLKQSVKKVDVDRLNELAGLLCG